MRGATVDAPNVQQKVNISIHAPRERSDVKRLSDVKSVDLFQSTLLVRGATPKTVNAKITAIISIHAPRERSDSGKMVSPRFKKIFQSTLLVRGATGRHKIHFAI